MFASMLTFNPRSKATNIGYLLSLKAVYWLQEENQTLLLHSPHLTQKKLKMILCPVLILAGTRNLIKKEYIRWISYQISKRYLVFIKEATHLDFYKKIE